MPELRDEKELEDYLFDTYSAIKDGYTTVRQFPLNEYRIKEGRYRISGDRSNIAL